MSILEDDDNLCLQMRHSEGDFQRSDNQLTPQETTLNSQSNGRRGEPVNLSSSATVGNRTITACLSYLAGTCNRAECRYAHLPPHIRLLPCCVCAYYATEHCKRGGMCRYFHGTMEELRAWKAKGVVAYNPFTNVPYWDMPEELVREIRRLDGHRPHDCHPTLMQPMQPVTRTIVVQPCHPVCVYAPQPQCRMLQQHDMFVHHPVLATSYVQPQILQLQAAPMITFQHSLVHHATIIPIHAYLPPHQ